MLGRVFFCNIQKCYETLSFKSKGDVISDHFLMLWFQKDSLDTVGFKGSRVLNQKVTFGVTGLGLSPKIYHFLTASLTRNSLLIGQLVISWKTAKAHLLLENRRAIDNL